MTKNQERDDQVRRLARVLAYREGAGVQWMDYNPLDDPKWINLAEDYIDFIITGGKIND
jgi:hypothetical protein